ncbi:MAG: hypothetical protein H8E72_01990 [Candidatus Marinimicrobia bacterium]|nr:hypothetical protein [Candidatus Neomarinimicrobiota bacterium]
MSETGHKHLHDHNKEIGIAIGVVPDHESSGGNLGIHLHYVKGLGHDNRYGIGLSLETIIDEHKHNSISIIRTYHFDKGFTIAYAPGLLFVERDAEDDIEFTQHFEFYYEFELNHFHIGPQFDIGFEVGEIHYMFGLHFGIDM